MLGPCLSAAGPHSYIIQCLVRFQVQIKFDRKQTSTQSYMIKIGTKVLWKNSSTETINFAEKQ